MKYSKYFGAKRHGFIKSKNVLAPKGAIHLLNENIRYDSLNPFVKIKHFLLAMSYVSGSLLETISRSLPFLIVCVSISRNNLVFVLCFLKKIVSNKYASR